MSWWSWLPTLPSIDLTLPSAIQKRFISFTLRQTLGHFLKPGQLDTQQVDSQIGSGYVQIRDVELDNKAINTLISGLPLQLHDGSVGKVTAKIPLPNPLTSTVGLSLESLHLTFYIIPDVSGTPYLDATNLAESVASVADTFIHEELSGPEEAPLRDSFYSELSESTSSLPDHLPGGLDPFSPEEAPRGDGEPPGVSLFATLVERLLSRFAFDAVDTKITIVHPEHASFTLSIPEIRYGTDVSGPSVSDSSSIHGIVRSVSISGVSVTTRLLTPPTMQLYSPGSSQDAPTINIPSGRTTPDNLPPPASPLSDSSEMDEDTQLLMSQSIAFLPPRSTSPTNSVASSMYESAISTSPKHEVTTCEEDVTVVSSPPHPTTPPPLTGRCPSPQPFQESPFMRPVVNTDMDDIEDELVFSLGKEPIIIRIITPLPSRSSPVSQASGPRQHTNNKGKQKEQVDSTGALQLSIRVPVIACALRAQNIRSLIEAANTFSTHSPPMKEAMPVEPPKQGPSLFDHVEGDIQIRGVVVVLVPTKTNLEDFFAHPLIPPPLQQGYVRVLMEGWSASFSLQNEPTRNVVRTSTNTRQLTASFSLSELSIFAFLSQEASAPQPNLHASPILITDPYLGTQYPTAHKHPDVSSWDYQGSLPVFDVVDWTDPVHRSESTRLSQWRTRPHQHKSMPRDTPTQRKEDPLSSSPRSYPFKSASPRSLGTSPSSGTPKGLNDLLSRPRHPAISAKLTFVSTTRLSSRSNSSKTTSSVQIDVKLAPLHTFVDVALCLEGSAPGSPSKLISFINELVPPKSNLPDEEIDDDETGTTGDLNEEPGTPRAGTPPPFGFGRYDREEERERKRLERLVLDDLDLGFDYLQGTPRKKSEPESPNRRRSHHTARGSKQGTTISVDIPALRLQVRGPSKFSEARSGAVILDIHDLRISPGGSPEKDRGLDDPSVRFTTESPPPRNRDTGNPLVACTWQRLLVAYCPVREHKATTIVSIGPFMVKDLVEGGIPVDGPTHPKAAEIAFPWLTISQTSSARPSANTESSRMAVALEIPSVHCELSKASFDGLQLWADDLSRLAERALNPPSDSPDDNDSRNSSIIGSRYFAKATSQSSGINTPSTITTTRRPRSSTSSETVVKVSVSEVAVRLLVPRSDERQSIRPFDVIASDLDVLLELKPEGKDETVVSVSLSDLTVTDCTTAGAALKLLNLTVPKNLSPNPRSLLSLRFTSLVVPGTTAKESKVKVTLCGVTYTFTPNLEWIQELSNFAKAPPGVFESVVPSERTHISLALKDTSVKLLAPVYQGSVVIYVGETEFSTIIVGGAQDSAFHLYIQSLALLLVDDVTSKDEGDQVPGTSGVSLWKNEGYALLGEIGEFDLRFQRDDSTPPPDIRVFIDHGSLRMHLCADTITALAAFIPDFTSLFSTSTEPPPKPERKEPTAVSDLKQSQSRRGIMASLDEDAFRRPPEVGPAPDMIYDDLPTNLEYLDESFSASAGLRELPDDESEDDIFQHPTTSPGNTDGIISYHGGETIRMFQPELGTVEHFFDTLQPATEDEGSQYGETTLKVRVQHCDVTLFLYDGYDWARTRRIIEDEAKNMRRKLAKIRQLVANGQTPDPSVEETNTLLFNSVYIGLEHNVDELEPTALIAAIDDELNEDSETGSQSSWQSFKPRSPSQKHSSSRSASTQRKVLTRSKGPSIEFRLLGLHAEIDNYRSHPELAARTLVQVRDIEILDHIKTSTWKKFLTDLMTDSKGNIRETGSNMARVELRKVYPVPGNESQEARLRAKILPLRLHVDQDALDFLKKFFSFKDPDSVVAEPSEPSEEIFFQQAEVFPVDLKLDYKPRRVDYRALRDGKTIELMNFFHFDGAEMTLRHIVLRGITGWARFFDLLNDLWTPDVKATQLVDVISGVAPIRSVVNVGSGVADLVLLPIAQYRKDGRVVRGLQKGTTAFVRSTATEAIKLGARLATGTQVILEQAETVLGGQFKDPVTTEAIQVNATTPGLDVLDDDPDLVSRYANQPKDVKEGVQSAYQSLRKNLNSAAQTILAVPMEVYERSGSEGTVRAVVRAVPIAVLRPMIGASEAIGKTLLGFHNTLDPHVRLENEAKYK